MQYVLQKLRFYHEITGRDAGSDTHPGRSGRERWERCLVRILHLPSARRSDFETIYAERRKRKKSFERLTTKKLRVVAAVF